MSEKSKFKSVTVGIYKELPDIEIMGVSAKALQRRFGEDLRKIVEKHGLPSQAEEQPIVVVVDGEVQHKFLADKPAFNSMTHLPVHRYTSGTVISFVRFR